MPYVITKRADVHGDGLSVDAVSRRAVATLEEWIVFDAREWKSAGYDQPEGNERFWHHALILSEYETDHRDRVADVLFLHDGRISHGHILNSMNSVTTSDRFVPESGGSVGPLPDGTVIEVAPVTTPDLAAAVLVANDYHWGELTEAEIIATYNAKQAYDRRRRSGR